MCMFSRNVDYVSSTQIYARGTSSGSQFLVYSLLLEPTEEMAMILPLPVPKDLPEDAVRFLRLDPYPDFFRDLSSGFPSSLSFLDQTISATKSKSTLQVHDLGAFEASFVPKLTDFDRLDTRFRLRDDVWPQLPEYADWGFAVIKLKSPELNRIGDPFLNLPEEEVIEAGDEH